MNIQLTELQVIDGQSITKRLSGILGDTITAAETYAYTAEFDGTDYSKLTLMPVSFKWLGGIIVKTDGVSSFSIYGEPMFFGQSYIRKGPIPVTDAGIIITPMFKIIDTAKVLTAVASDGTITLTLDGKNYLYSTVTGTPITGKLNVVGRSIILSSGGRIAQLVIDVVLKEGDVLGEMTSDQYNTRVAEELQRKIDYFFGTTHATCVYDTTTSCYKITLLEAGATPISITADSLGDLSYFGFVSPTYLLGSEPLAYPMISVMTGEAASTYALPATITGPATITIGHRKDMEISDFVNAWISIGDCVPINYDIVLYQ